MEETAPDNTKDESRDPSKTSASKLKTSGEGGKEGGLSYEKYETADSLELFLKDNTPDKNDAAQEMLTAIVDEKLEATLAVSCMAVDPDKLGTHDWYHGCLPFEDIAGLLKSDGDFLVRELAPDAGRSATACVTVKWDGKVRNYPVRYMRDKKAHMFTIDGDNKFRDVMQLVRNVVTFYGIVQQTDGRAMIVMELIHGGALDQHLKNNPTIGNKERIGYATDVAIGLVYLHSKGCMHRDVACRNCLIDVRKNIVKLSDFGLSKQAELYNIPDDERLPIRWYEFSQVF
ncbi:SH2 domain protein [Ancylostoma ceylanicum]|uniref:Tyrosine-protein kinase n=1 Tax=Ancylostoma ceylanicum TaxID=53326 RepID=A0A0D6LJY5_9BILA|nr:SH2 domain protein [Ancylostoma ceylanicum]